jgi:putative aldouronate transport system substrate-binding protein
MKTKFFTGILIVALAAVLLSGCSKKPGPAQSGGTSITQVSSDNPSWSQDKTPYTLSWFVAYDWYGKSFNPEINLGDKRLLEQTGISLDIQVGNTEKLNLLISTGSLPDMVTFDVVAPQRRMLESGGVLLDLEDLAAKYAPDLNVPQSMKDWLRGDDGKWYAVASFYYGPERTTPEFGGYYVTHNLNYARTDILDSLGLSMGSLSTKEGFLAALRAVKKGNITYNGKPMLPYIGGSPEGLAAQFGADLEDRAGNLVNIKRTPEYLEALLYMNIMYNEGLLTEEQFIMTTQQQDQKIANGEVFAASGWPGVENPRKALYSLDPNARFMYAGPIKGGDSGKTPILEGVNCGGWTGTMITKNSKNPAKAIQFMSYMTSEIPTIAAYRSTDGFDMIDGMAIQKPEVVREYEQNYQAADSKYNMNIYFFVDWTIIERCTPLDPNVNYYDIDHFNQEHDKSVEIYDNKAFAFINPDDGTDLAVTRIKIDDYWKQQLPVMVMARNADECRRLYQDAITQAESLGLKELEAFQNQRFLENKKKLGQANAWPRYNR